MSAAKPDLDLPDFWTEEAYLSLGETKARIELIDGGLWVSPSPTIPHNIISRLLANNLATAAETAELLTVQAPNLRLAADRILIPDVAVGAFGREAVTVPAFEAVLAVEITSPSNAAVDRTLKKTLYAEAKIDWYLIVEPDFRKYRSLSLHLFRREDQKYVLHAEAAFGETLVSNEPFPLEIETAALLKF
jgi:Uma2 family endonuclease